MGNTKIISIGGGGKNILEGIQKVFSPDIETASLSADSGKTTEIAINQVFQGDITKLVMISCLGGRSSTIVPEVVKNAKKKSMSASASASCRFPQREKKYVCLLKRLWI